MGHQRATSTRPFTTNSMARGYTSFVRRHCARVSALRRASAARNVVRFAGRDADQHHPGTGPRRDHRVVHRLVRAGYLEGHAHAQAGARGQLLGRQPAGGRVPAGMLMQSWNPGLIKCRSSLHERDGPTIDEASHRVRRRSEPAIRPRLRRRAEAAARPHHPTSGSAAGARPSRHPVTDRTDSGLFGFLPVGCAEGDPSQR